MNKRHLNSPDTNPAAADELFGMNYAELPLPTNDLVMLEQEKEVTSDLVLIPDSANEKSPYFKVISIGPGRHTDAGQVIHPPCKVGDRVYANINQSNALPFRQGGKQFFLVQGLNIMGIFPESSAELN